MSSTQHRRPCSRSSHALGAPPAQLAVAAPNQMCVDAAFTTVAQGGNAVDAAIAAILTSAVGEIGFSSCMGSTFVTIWPAHCPPVVIDGNAAMPGLGAAPERFGGGLDEVYVDYLGGKTLIMGAGAVAVPGTMAALDTARTHYGHCDWGQLVAPAVAAARSGYPIGQATALYLAATAGPVFGRDPQAHRLTLGIEGQPLRTGELTTNPDLADTLELVARQGITVLSTGCLGQRMVRYLQQNGGLLTCADLASYQAEVREPIMVDVGGWELALPPPPSVGGPMLALMLREAFATHADAAGLIPLIHRVASFRDEVHTSASDLEREGWRLLNKARWYGLESLCSSGSTVHVSAVDSSGTLCAITSSIGYGNGLCVPDTGLILNNALGEPELNKHGLHTMTPGRRLASNMSPLVGRCSDGRRLALGTPGSARITTALLQVLLGYCRDGQTLPAAVDAPRLHVGWRQRDASETGTWVVQHEQDPQLAAAAANCGLSVTQRPYPSMFFGGVAAVASHPDGSLEAAADLRRAMACHVK